MFFHKYFKGMLLFLSRDRLAARLVARVREDPAVKRWIGRLSEKYGSNSLSVFQQFYREVLSNHFRGMTPSELVNWQIDHMTDRRERHRIGDLARDWVSAQDDLRLRTKELMYSRIRSFFAHNRAELPSDRTFRFTSTVPPVVGRLTVEKLRRIILNCNDMYRAIFLMMFQGGMDEGALVYVNTHCAEEILQNLTKNVGVFKIYLPGRKRSRYRKSFYTLLSTKGDWADAFRTYMKSTPLKDFTVLYRNTRGEPLKKHNIAAYFHAHAVKAGVIKQFTPPCKCGGYTVRRKRLIQGHRKVGYLCKECGKITWASDINNKFTNIRYGVNAHEMRDVGCSRWHASGADPDVFQFMMQHEIDLNKYDKFMTLESWYPIREYRKALEWMNIITKDPTKVDRSSVDLELEGTKEELKVLRQQVVMLRQDREDLSELVELLRDPKKMSAFKRLLHQK
jgi:hypothetical protein